MNTVNHAHVTHNPDAWCYRIPVVDCSIIKEIIEHRVSITSALTLFTLLIFSIIPGDSTQLSKLHLSSYQLSGAPVVLEGVSNNASGLTFNSDTQTLFAVINNPTQIVELTTDGHVLRFIELKGFSDTEGLVYLGKQQYALIEEGRRHINIISIDSGSYRINREVNAGIALAFSSERNKGFEGIAADTLTGNIYVVNEKFPRQLLKVEGLLGEPSNAIRVSTPWNFEEHTLDKSDLAGLHFHPSSGHLLILSEESRTITEVDLMGTEYSQLKLRNGFASIESSIPQPEGVTMDDSGNLYVVSEPNLFYRFKRS